MSTPNYDKLKGWRRYLTLAIGVSIVCGILYLISAFVGASWSPQEWHWSLRTVVAIALVAIAGFIIEKI